MARLHVCLGFGGKRSGIYGSGLRLRSQGSGFWMGLRVQVHVLGLGV